MDIDNLPCGGKLYPFIFPANLQSYSVFLSERIVVIYLFLMLFIYLSFWPCCAECGILVPWPGIKPMSPALEAWSLNHWTARKSWYNVFLNVLISFCLTDWWKTSQFVLICILWALHEFEHLWRSGKAVVFLVLLSSQGMSSQEAYWVSLWRQ